MRLLVVVGVVFSRGIAVVGVHRFLEGVGRNVQPLGQLLDTVCLHHVAVLDQLVDHGVDSCHGDVVFRAVREGEKSAAADLVELLGVLRVVRVPDGAVGMVRLHVRGVQHVVVRAALVAEAPSVQVHLQVGLLAEPKPAARRAVSGGGVRLAAGAVEQHRGADGVFTRAHPHHRLDAQTRGGVARAVHRDLHVEDLRLQGAHHLQRGGVAARGHDDALAGLHAHVLVGLLVAGDQTRDAAAAVLLKLHQAMLKTPVDLGFAVRVLLENLLDGLRGGLAVFLGAVACGKGAVALAVLGA